MNTAFPAPVYPAEQSLNAPVFTPVTTQEGLVSVWPGNSEQGMQMPFTLGPDSFEEHSSDEDSCSQQNNEQSASHSRRGKDLLATLHGLIPRFSRVSSHLLPQCSPL